MNQQALQTYLLALADDELILAHRNSEWIGHAPILEEDIAIANIAQDELGHATLWYDLYCHFTGDDPDQLVFQRNAAGYRNAQLVELPKGDWAFTILRQYLFDVFEVCLLAGLMESAYQPLAETAVKIRNEELYHHRHTHSWVERLGLGTAESHGRMQSALNQLWPFAHQLFIPLPDEADLVTEGIVSKRTAVAEQWQAIVIPHLTDSGLVIPPRKAPPTRDRADHTPHLDALLADLQQVTRQHPEAAW
ncbi:MAG: 1,2-phenylacetyl-CoA epoxidase subunit PaaC [Anaerolineae bacterium]